MNSPGAVVVTGASQGIGAATALLAASKGYPVCVSYLSNHDEATAVVRKIEAAGGQAIAVAGDVGEQSDVISLFDEAEDKLGPLYGLVNNAAILEPQTGFQRSGPERVQRILSTDVMGCFLCAGEAVRRMSVSNGGKGGTIVNVSSVAARTGSPNEYIDYAMSKGALDSMTAGLAREVAADGIRVNAVRPGFIHTAMHAKGGEPGRVERLSTRIPLRRGGQPEEVARTILWLMSDEASYAVGTVVDVTGGV